MQGIFVNGTRPKSKKAVKEAVAAGDSVRIEATSLFGNEYDGSPRDMPVGTKAYCVGPDPYTSRKFYLTIERTADGVKVS